MKTIVWLLFLVSTAQASDYNHFIFKDALTKSCAYVHKADTWYESLFSRQIPQLQLSPPNEAFFNRNHFFGSNGTLPSREGFQLHTLIMSADDILKVDFGATSFLDSCDEAASGKELCYSENKPDPVVTLSEFIESKNNTAPLKSFTYDTSTEFEYTFEKSGTYCVVFHQESMLSFDYNDFPDYLTNVNVNWQSSYGELQLVDYKRLLLSLYLTLAYGAYFMVYAGIVAKRVSNVNSNPVKVYQKMRFMFQYKILSFLAGAFLIQIIAVINYLFINRYENDSVSDAIVLIFGILELVSSTLFTFWIIYNLMLFSAGAWVASLKKSDSKVLISRVTCATLVFETLWQHINHNTLPSHPINHYTVPSRRSSHGREYAYEMVSTKFILIGALCFVWSFYTTYKICDRPTKKLYIRTIFLLGVMFVGAIILKFIHRSYKIEYLKSGIEFATMVIFTLLWKDVTFQKGALCLE